MMDLFDGTLTNRIMKSLIVNSILKKTKKHNTSMFYKSEGGMSLYDLWSLGKKRRMKRNQRCKRSH